MSNVSIRETYELPSKGLIYEQPINPKIQLRSMTTADEMKSLSSNGSQYESLSTLIDDCIVSEKLPISVYDMCIGDYEFLLHKLRVVTYGSSYPMNLRCPNCGEVTKFDVDLDKEEVLEFKEEDIEAARNIELPVSKKRITLNFQTPHILDNIKEKAKEKSRKKPELKAGYEFMYGVMSFINSIDGKHLNEVQLEEFVKKLSMQDTNYIVQKGTQLNRKVGIDNTVIAKCGSCNYEVVTTFRIGPEFFTPEVN